MLKERLLLCGLCPERALVRLTKSGISVYRARKKDAKSIAFSVRKKDLEKVFAIYPNVCYNGDTGCAYCVRRLPLTGFNRLLSFLKNRWGLLVGTLVFVLTVSTVEKTVLRIEIDAPEVYRAQVLEILREYGVQPYAWYVEGKEDLICAHLLSKDGVSGCSVQKRGVVLTVSLRTNSFVQKTVEEPFTALRAGELVRLVTLRGTPLKRAGDAVALGETLVSGVLQTEGKDPLPVRVVAYATISCEWTGQYPFSDETKAEAQAYLDAGLDDERATLVESKVLPSEDGATVTVRYLWTQRVGI